MRCEWKFLGRRLWLALWLALTMGLAQAAIPPSQALSKLTEAGAQAVEAYAAGSSSGEQAAAEFSRLYFDVFEAAGIELLLGSRDRALMQSIELGFARCIQSGLERRPPEAMREAWGRLQADLERARPIVSDGEAGTGWAVAGQSAVIVLREGLEALLVVSALAGFLGRSGQRDRLPWLWAGVGTAVLVSAALAWALSDLLGAVGAWRGALQGLMVLLAAAMLAQMAAWMYARRSAERWNQVLRAQMTGARDGMPWLTAAVSFVAVFREGAETILFFHALGGSTQGQWGPLAMGAAAAAAVLTLVFFSFQRMGRRLPYAAFFVGTASVLLLIALVFAGKGTLYLQMAGWLPSTDWQAVPALGWLGVYPLRETVAAQLLLVVMVVALTVWSGRASTANAAR